MPRSPSKTVARRASTVVLSLLSLLGALVVCEAALRLFHPKYEDVAQSQRYQADESRIWAPIPNTSRYKAHPDTGRRHPVIYNEFGSRQHRRFDVDALKDAENIAFFGDSFVENTGIEAQYSFTEVLDFLLNHGAAEGRPSHGDHSAFNVLNFGVDGYGPGQEFVWYRQFPHSEDLDHVFYVFCDNDINNFHHHHLFSLDESGDLVPNVAVTRGLLTTALSRFHLTYLVLDFAQRLDLMDRPTVPTPVMTGPPPGQIEPIHKINERILMRKQHGAAPSEDALDNSVAAFQALLLHWRGVVESHGGEFHVVVPPYMNRESVQGVFPTQLEVSYLLECFIDEIPQFHYSDWRFRTDAHWNEAGNMVAAHCLYRLLEESGDLPLLSEAALANARHKYYSAVGTGWNPPADWVAPLTTSTASAAGIVSKYMELDDRHRVLESLARSTPAARADWLVHLLPRRPSGRAALAYVKAPCRREDRQTPFFLHVTPRDAGQLSEERAVHGFDNLDFNFEDAWGTVSAGDISRESWMLNDSCVFSIELPLYEIARVRTGQYTVDELVWDVEFEFDISTGAVLRQHGERQAPSSSDGLKQGTAGREVVFGHGVEAGR